MQRKTYILKPENIELVSKYAWKKRLKKSETLNLIIEDFFKKRGKNDKQ